MGGSSVNELKQCKTDVATCAQLSASSRQLDPGEYPKGFDL